MQNLLNEQTGGYKRVIVTELIDCDVVESTIYTTVKNNQSLDAVADNIRAVLLTETEAICCDIAYWEIDNGCAKKILQLKRHFLQQDRAELKRELTQDYALLAN